MGRKGADGVVFDWDKDGIDVGTHVLLALCFCGLGITSVVFWVVLLVRQRMLNEFGASETCGVLEQFRESPFKLSSNCGKLCLECLDVALDVNLLRHADVESLTITSTQGAGGR